ncbi:chemosensory pili system protein ChpC [Luteimonas cucumeris]|uniref:Chemosensory pili system protein ChpC n=1 Tax=Luteimonas cucumeris TaxID=985012 RepID=A0A562L5E9_9GAMM|nr:chemotaxis protein CheW [Luteimonas cucumeris]TWI02736.1 chemosensory pili system protein ChpC [Luteimonas cucumeris]
MANASNDIRGVLIQVTGARLLLPNATIAEVLSYAQPEPVDDAPEWLLGHIRWRGWRLPLIAFSRMAGIAEENAVLGNKVLVLKALGGNSRLPFFALLTQGFPRLVTVAHDELSEDAHDGEALPAGVQARVLLKEDAALLPDLAALENRIGEFWQAA